MQVQYLRDMIAYGEANKIEYVSLKVVRGILDAPNDQVLDKWKSMFVESRVRPLGFAL